MKLTIASALIAFTSITASAEDAIVSRIYQKKMDSHYYTVNYAAWYIIKSPGRDKPEDVGIHDPKYCVDSGDVFVASDKQLPGTFQLVEWRNRDKYQYFYARGNTKPPNPDRWIESKDFHGEDRPWVWEKPGPGLVPVYCSGHPDNSDVFFTTDKKEHEAKIANDLKFKKVKRTDLGVVFYAKKAPPRKEKIEAKLQK